MKITELLKKDTIVLDLSAKTKAEVIEELVNKLHSAGRLNDKEEYKKAILNREEQFSTGLGDGIAIPHAKTAAVKVPALAFGRSKEGIDYESLDGNPAHVFFMIAASEGAHNDHIETLSRLSTMLMNEDFRNKLMETKTAEEVLTLIDSSEEEKLEEESTEAVALETTEASKGFVLAVTACPTGIAHTYMAADALKNKAKEMGVTIKVETNGSTGIKNALTEDDINRASGIIVAADKQVEMARFNGKKVIQVPVVQGIKKSEELINRALNGDAPVYQHTGGTAASAGKSERTGFYKHLMSGVSNMLPFVVGGGILIAISFMFGIKAFDPKDPTYQQIAKLLIGYRRRKCIYL